MTTATERSAISPWTRLGLGLFALAIGLAGVRFAFGLGAIANINDAYPWGWWIGMGVMSFISFGGAGFTMALLADVIGIRRFEPFVRPGMVVGLLFYLSYTIILSMEIGRPWKGWIVFFSWAHTSAMFEIAWCATLYTVCLSLEFGKMATEKVSYPKAGRVLSAIYLPVVLFGVTISHFHQSSLGTMMTIVPLKVDERWWSELLPVFFLLTAYAAGIAVVTIEHVLATRYLRLKPRPDLLASLGLVQLAVIGSYLVLRFGDLVFRGVIDSMLTLEGMSFAVWAELIGGYLVPFALLAVPGVRNALWGTFTAACFVVFGNVLMKNNVTVTGMRVESWQSYVPAAGEVLTTLGVLAGAVVLYGWLLRVLPIHAEEPLDPLPSEAPSPARALQPEATV